MPAIRTHEALDGLYEQPSLLNNPSPQEYFDQWHGTPYHFDPMPTTEYHQLPVVSQHPRQQLQRTLTTQEWDNQLSASQGSQMDPMVFDPMAKIPSQTAITGQAGIHYNATDATMSNIPDDGMAWASNQDPVYPHPSPDSLHNSTSSSSQPCSRGSFDGSLSQAPSLSPASSGLSYEDYKKFKNALDAGCFNASTSDPGIVNLSLNYASSQTNSGIEGHGSYNHVPLLAEEASLSTGLYHHPPQTAQSHYEDYVAVSQATQTQAHNTSNPSEAALVDSSFLQLSQDSYNPQAWDPVLYGFILERRNELTRLFSEFIHQQQHQPTHLEADPDPQSQPKAKAKKAPKVRKTTSKPSKSSSRPSPVRAKKSPKHRKDADEDLIPPHLPISMLVPNPDTCPAALYHPKPPQWKKTKNGEKKLHICRPSNSFILFRASLSRMARGEPTGKKRKKGKKASDDPNSNSDASHEQMIFSKYAGQLWSRVPPEDKAKWERLASLAEKLHKEKYPNYVFTPRSSKKSKSATLEYDMYDD